MIRIKYCVDSTESLVHPNLVLVKIDPGSNVKEPVSCLLNINQVYIFSFSFVSANLRCQLESSEECLLVDVSALVPGCLAQTQRLPHCVLNLELCLDHLGGVQRVGVRRAPVILQS